MNIKDNPFEGSELTTILVVSDMEKSKAFYLDKLGASIYREYGGDSMVMSFLNSWILIVTGSGETDDKPGTQFRVPADPNTFSHSFTIRVNDCEESYKILKSRGISFITPPYKRGPETRCFFRDPDGHLFEISEYRSA
ncbi:VOC family protein [Cryomorphaceae bacterium 1068]|nr:VOC family protein [Cryomorphaceae bacterium 1068]